MASVFLLKYWRDYNVHRYIEVGVRQKIGSWLSQNTPAEATVFLEPLGYIGYYSDRRMIDSVGIVSPQVVSAVKAGGRMNFPYLIDCLCPDYIVILEAHFDRLDGLNSYTVVRRFDVSMIAPGSVKDNFDTHLYVLQRDTLGHSR